MNSQHTITENYNGLLGLDNSDISTKFVIWVVAYIFVSQFTIDIYSNIINSISCPVRNQFGWVAWLAVGSPIILTSALLRLLGIKWKYSLLLLIAVPVAIGTRYFFYGLLWGLMGG